MTPNRKKLIKRLAKRDGGMRCFLCRKRLTYDEVTIDHWLPLAAGGSDREENYRLACRPCNNEKSDTIPLPDKTIPRRPRKVYASRGERPYVCTKCDAGRKLFDGETCMECGSGPMPLVRPRYMKMSSLECDHEIFWCSMCCTRMEATG